MSASLVGSEMCIRDSAASTSHPPLLPPTATTTHFAPDPRPHPHVHANAVLQPRGGTAELKA
eukprot:3499718-Alexandrium_andersonii.AAC.1